MNMSVLPIINSQADGQAAGKAKNAGDNYTFAHAIEHSQKNPDKSKYTGQALAHGHKNSKTSKPADKNADPEQTLALIIDTIALPLLKSNTAASQIPAQLHDKQTGTNFARYKSSPVNAPATGIEFRKTDIQLAIENTGEKTRPSKRPSVPDFAAKKTINTEQSHKKLQLNTDRDKLQGKINDFKKYIITGQKLDTEFTLKAQKSDHNNGILQLNAKPVNLAINQDQAAQVTTDTSISNGFSSQLEPATNSFTGINNRNLILHTNFGSPNWAHDFGSQLVNISQNSLHLGQITMQLNPPELGPVQISLHVNDGITQAMFVSPHASVRHAIESALPNLQDQMDQAGISLGQTTVSDHGAAQQDFEQNHQQASNTLFSPDLNHANQQSPESGHIRHVPRSRPDALIDTFV